MAFTTPGTAVAGEVLTAAFWNEQVRDNMLMGNPVFTNEAARDAAIPSPVEGQRCYLTAPTIPAATGEDIFLPSGIQTIYNGSAWVCVTPVSAFTSNVGSTTSTSFTTSLTGTPGANPSVTLVTGQTALISISAGMLQSTTSYNEIEVQVSGATTLALGSNYGIFWRPQGTTQNEICANTIVLPSLNAGTNTFTLAYRVLAGTGNFNLRRITVQGIA